MGICLEKLVVSSLTSSTSKNLLIFYSVKSNLPIGVLAMLLSAHVNAVSVTTSYEKVVAFMKSKASCSNAQPFPSVYHISAPKK